MKQVTSFPLWKNSLSVINCFSNIDNNHLCQFMKIDSVEIYPSGTKSHLHKALEFLKRLIPITDSEINIITHAKITLVFHKNSIWFKHRG